MKKLAIALTFSCLFSISGLNAQERLIGLQNNPELLDKDHSLEKGRIVRAASSIALPFIDDFAKPGPFPDQTKWEGNSVFVNDNFAVNMPTVGVATFDAIDAKGRLYDVAGTFSKPADTLTSREIDLRYTAADNLMLSFCYQAGGLGDMPESSDSLTLQFLNSSNEWVEVWSARASQRDSTIVARNRIKNTVDTVKTDSLYAKFFTAYIKVDQADFLYDGFRFRFVNYASVALNSFVPGRASNADHWHIDLVYLNRARTEGDYIPDVAITTPQQPFKHGYESIPWRHFSNQAYSQLFGSQLTHTFSVINLGLSPASIGLNVKITPLIGNGESYNFSAGFQNIPAIGDIQEYPLLLPSYSFYSDRTDSAAFELRSYIITNNDPAPLRREFRYNDTTRYTYKFYDYYAYDDGTAENGYGLYGSGSSTGSVAVKYQSYAQDSLRGVYLYFNKTVNEVNTSNKIKLAVWSDNGLGQPGEQIYAQDTVRPTTSNELNRFVAYKFSKAIPIGNSQTFYVGWTHTSEDFVNIGFDRNRNHQDKAFYYLNGAWNPSAYEGVIMMRPIFTEAESNFPPDPVLPPVQNSVSDAVTPVPNPASDRIRLLWKDRQAEPMESKVEIFDMSGRMVKTLQAKHGESIDVSTLAKGIYFVRISDGKKVVETSKMIKR